MAAALKRCFHQAAGRQAQIMLEFCLSILIFLLLMAGLAWLGQLSIHRAEMPRLLAHSQINGLGSLAAEKQQHLLKQIAQIPPTRIRISKTSTASSKRPRDSRLPLPTILDKLFDLLMGTRSESLQIQVPRFMPHFVPNGKIDPQLNQQIIWDQDPLANDGRLKLALWGIALAKAAVNSKQLSDELGLLRKRGGKWGSGEIPDSLPGLEKLSAK